MTAIRTSQEIVDVVGVRCLATQIDENLVDDLVSFYKRKEQQHNQQEAVGVIQGLSVWIPAWLAEAKPTIEWLKEGKGRIRFVSEDEVPDVGTVPSDGDA